MQDYHDLYASPRMPMLPFLICRYFSTVAPSGNEYRPRSVGEFVQSFDPPASRPSGEIVDAICKRLCEYGHLTPAGKDRTRRLGPAGNCYIGPGATSLSGSMVPHELDCDVYGFPYIYDAYENSVLPILHRDTLGALQAGSSFVVADDILVTAAHCVEQAKSISVKGIAVKALEGSQAWQFANRAMDVALISFGEPVLSRLRAIQSASPRILQPVMALGYPNVPGFHQTLAAEKAIISSRFTAVAGTVAAFATDLWTPTELLLVTARVRGGFSGGPLLSERGKYVGMVTSEPASEVAASEEAYKYDNLGYGVAVPAAAIDELIADVRRETQTLARRMEPVAFEEYT